MLTPIQCPFQPFVTAVAHKKKTVTAQSADGMLHLNTHTPLTQQSWSGLTMPLCRHIMGIYLETSSHVSREGTLSHSHLSSLSHHGLILT